jgi:hypothetical protein
VKATAGDDRASLSERQRISPREAAERYLPTASAVAIGPAGVGVSGGQGAFRGFLGNLLLIDPPAQAIRSGTGIHLNFSDSVTRWLTDPRIFHEFLAGGITAGPDSFNAPRRRPVEVGRTTTAEIRADAEAGRLWVCRIEWRGTGAALPGTDGNDRVRRVGWLVREVLPDSGGSPGKSLARALQRLKSGVEAMGLEECRVGIARQNRSTVERDGALLKIGTDEWEAFWPVEGVLRLAEALAAGTAGEDEHPGPTGDDGENPVRGPDRSPGLSMERAITAAAVAILAAEIGVNGISSLVYHVPRTPEERLSVHAIRTMAALSDGGGRVVDRFVDSVYRSGRRFRAFTVLYRLCGNEWRQQFDRALGPRRLAQFPDGSVPIPPEFANPAAPGAVWRTFAVALEELVGEYARNARRRGMALDAASMEILARWYHHPRSDAMRSVWERSRKDRTVADRLEHGRLSVLRDLARGVPRRILIDAATGRDERTKQRLAAVFSRHGRRLFLEDVDAREAAIARNDAVEWEQILAAHRRLSALAERLVE